MESKVMRTREAAKYIGVSAWKLRMLARQGKVGFVSDGDRTSALRFLVADLDRYLEKHHHPAK